MTTLSIQPPYPIITGADGQPLEDGYVWIGAANLNPITNPIAVYWDAALTQPAALPVRTRGGYPVNAGTPARLYVGSDYSILVQNKNGSTVYSAPSAKERYGNIISFADITGTLGSDRVTFLQAGTNAVARTVENKLKDALSVFDFMTAAQIADVRSGAATLDVTASIQAAINAAIYNNSQNTLNGLKVKVHLPGGKYRITNTIHIGYGTLTSQFTSCVLEGDGFSYRGEIFAGTAIIADFNDRMAINVQGARGSVIRGIAIIGKNQNYITNNRLGSILGTLNGIDDTIAGNWVDPTFPAIANSRYAPYAGIAIDGYSGFQPAISYPSVTYPAFLATNTQYEKANSSNVLIQDVYIDGFVVGVVNQPSDADANADYTALVRVSIERCVWGISVCNTQSRAFKIDHCQTNFTHTALTTNKHGRQNGRLNGTISNFNAGAGTQYIDLNASAIYGPVTFLHSYCESLWRLGFIAAGGNTESSLIFQSCLFGFENMGETVYNPTGTRGVPGKLLEGAQDVVMDLRFIGCAIVQFVGVASIWQRGAKMEGTIISARNRESSLNPATQLYIAHAHNMLAGGLITPNLRVEPDQRIKFAPFDLTNATVQQSVFSENGNRSSTRQTCIPLFTWYAAAKNEPFSDQVQTPKCVQAIGKSSLTISLTNKTLTVNFPGRTDDSFNLFGPDNGDVIIDDLTGMTFFVRARTGTTITAEAQNNYKPDGAGGFVPIQAFSTTSGNFYWSTGRIYTPEYYLRGNTSSISAVINNCARDDGFAAWYDSQIAVNDRVYIIDTQDNWAPVASTIISARDQSAGTITLSGNASRTETRRRLALFVRQPPANV